MMTTATAQYRLYYTLGCHLCDDAEAAIQPVARYLQHTWHKVDIADDDALIERYGIRIPVLLHVKSGAELGWPFDSDTVLAFMESTSP